MKTGNNHGEVVTLILVGLAIGTVAMVVNGNRWAQQRANTLGAPVGIGSYVAENPVQAIGLPLLGAGAGWGLQALIDNQNNDPTDDPQVVINAGRDSTVVFSGRDGTGSTSQDHYESGR